MNLIGSKHVLAMTIACFSSALALPVSAQMLEEITVTAQKRAESVQDVPLSIVAIDQQRLENAGITSVEDLPKIVPSLQMDVQQQSASLAIRIRGIGTQGNNAIDPSVAPFIDDVYMARAGAILTSFLDVSGVEVLRGPQGTLFGRNATTGALLIHTHAPDFDAVSGEVFGEYGNFDAYRVRGIVNVPVSDTFAMRFAAQVNETDGDIYNRFDDKDYRAREQAVARASFRWQPNESIDWTVRVDWAELKGDGASPAEVSSNQGPAHLVNAFGSAFGPLSADISDPFDGEVHQLTFGFMDDTQWGLSSDLLWDLESDYQIRWIGSYRSWENEQLDGDVIFTAMDLLSRTGHYDSESTSQELQLISPENALFGDRMDFVAGVYFFQEDYALGENAHLGSSFCPALAGPLAPVCQAFPLQNATVQTFEQDAESMAVFLETNWDLTDSLELKLGARYTSDDKEGSILQVLNNPFGAAIRSPEQGDLEFDDSQFTYRIVLSWFANDDIMYFANYSTGYKSGGLNSGGSATSLEGRRIFKSEDVTDVEIGLKSTLADGRLQLNATAYSMDIEDFQDRAFQDASFIITNAGKLRQRGLETELRAAPNEHWTIGFELAYLDSEFLDFQGATPLAGCQVLPPPGTPSCQNPQDNTGKSAPYSPEWEFNVGIDYENVLPNGMPWSANVNWQYVDDHYAGGTELSSQTITDAYNILDARLSLSSADLRWTVSAWVQNLTDERFATSHFTQVLGAALGLLDTSNGDTVYRHYMNAPRTYGISVKYQF